MNTRKKTLIIGALAFVGVGALAMAAHSYDHLHALAPKVLTGGGGGLFLAGMASPAATGEFETEVLEGIKAVGTRVKSLEDTTGTVTKKIESDVQKVLNDLERSDKEVKKAIEDITKLKSTCNDQAELMAKIEKAQKAVVLNARSSFGDPIKRACANDETRAYLKGIAHMALNAGRTEGLPSEIKKLIDDGNAEVKSLTGVDSSLGQATVPTATFNEIYDALLEFGQWSTLGVQRVGARTTVLPVATARPTAYWLGAGSGVGEGSAITESGFTGGSVNLSIQTLGVYLTVARELLADSTVDLAPYLMRQMVQSSAYGLDYASFNAAAAANQTDGGYTGIFQAALANTNLAAVAANGNTTVAGLQLEDFVNVLTTVSPEVLMRKARWWMHPQILAKAVQIRDKQGRPLFQTWQEVPNPGSILSILGYPVTMVGAAPSTDSAGQPVMAFGDPDGMAVGIRQDLELATSDDIKFAENMRAFRALIRAGVKLKTTANSTSLKPFAVLTTAAA